MSQLGHRAPGKVRHHYAFRGAGGPPRRHQAGKPFQIAVRVAPCDLSEAFSLPHEFFERWISVRFSVNRDEVAERWHKRFDLAHRSEERRVGEEGRSSLW